MAEEVTIKLSGNEKVEEAMKRLGTNLPKAVVIAMRTVTLFLQAYMKTRKLTGGQPLHVRTGHLRSSIKARIEQDQEKTTGIVGSDLRYAKMHEFGKQNHHSSSGKYLTIPLDAAKTASGVARGPARSFQGTFLIKSKAGNLIIMGRPTPGASSVKPLFVLKKSVNIPARPYMAPTIEENRERVLGVFTKTLTSLSREVFA